MTGRIPGSLLLTTLLPISPGSSEEGSVGLDWIWDGLQGFMDRLNWGGLLTGAIDNFTQSVLKSFMASLRLVLEGIVLNPRTILSFSFVDSLYEVTRMAGIAILVLVVMWQAFKSMFAWAGFEADEPWRVAVKSVAFGLCTFWAKDILIWMAEISWRMMDLIFSAEGPASTGNIFAAIFGSIPGLNIGVFTVDFIVMIYLIVKMVSASYKMIERLLLSTLLIIFSPMAFACGVADSTKGFLQGFIRLFTGNLLIQLIQVGILSAVYIYQRETMASANFPLNFLAFFVLIALFKIMGKLEEIVRDMSISVGIGASMGGGLMQKASSAVYTTQSVVNVVRSFSGGGH